jgi:phosphoenolpyruvate carboxykinase (ATP)
VTVTLSDQGINTSAEILANLGTDALIEAALANGEGKLAREGALVVETGKHTGRSAKGQVHRPRRRDRKHGQLGQGQRADDARAFRGAQGRFPRRAAGKDKLYVADLFGGSQPEHRVNVRVINELAWHNLFIRTLLVRPTKDELPASTPNTRLSTCRASRPIPPPRHPQRDR